MLRQIRIHTRLAINEPSFKSHQFDLSSPDAHWKKDQGASSCDDLFLKRSFDVRGSLNLYLICGKTEIRPTYLMFFIPYLAVVSNNFRRIDRAKKRKPTVEEIAGEDYDPILQVRMEYGYLIGDISGWPLFSIVIE